MSEPAKKPASYKDLLALPEGTKAEILNGRVDTAPARPNFGHRHATVMLVRAIGQRFGGTGSGWILEIEPEVQFGPHILSPDLAGWKTERRGQLNPLEVLVTVVPDWVCEILSPSSGRRDRGEKFRVYRELNVGFYWILDPIYQTVEAFWNDGAAAEWKRLGSWGGDEKARIQPFQDLDLDLSTFWVK